MNCFLAKGETDFLPTSLFDLLLQYDSQDLMTEMKISFHLPDNKESTTAQLAYLRLLCTLCILHTLQKCLQCTHVVVSHGKRKGVSDVCGMVSVAWRQNSESLLFLPVISYYSLWNTDLELVIPRQRVTIVNSLLQQEICIGSYFSNFRLCKQGNFKKNNILNILKIWAFFSFLNLVDGQMLNQS